MENEKIATKFPYEDDFAKMCAIIEEQNNSILEGWLGGKK